ncbi:hypothetical protein A0H81_10923 [Grifola frondosa]|uniref:Uncharacterized protein n=1 Tax=Grifola frondosa TaxID=5627 RepID=A0A1C7LYI1_GRIFR|nr:hypothetical protein A0H81_10923 [Grifola frondosa]
MPLESSISDFFSPVGPLTTQNTGDTSSNIIMYDMDALGPVDRHILTLDASQSVDLSGPSNAQEMEAAEIPASTMFSPVTGLKFSTSHEKMDEEVMEELRQIPIRPSRSLILKLVVLGCKEIHSKFGGNFVIGWLDKYPDLFPIIDNCFDSGSFKELRELSLFWPPPPQEEEVSHVPDDPGDASAAKVTELAWEREYRGSAVDALWSHMNHVYERSHDKSSRSGVILYANYSAIVQSSGTGKSRMVDELAKRELVIPMNLRSYTSKKAFPPSDTVIYDYFRPTEDVTQLTALSRSYAFVTAVLNQTTEVIQGFEREGLEREDYVAAFRTYMTEGQTMEKQADKRVKFYEDAIEQAEKMHKEWSAAAGGRPIHTTPKKSAPGKANDASNVAAPTPDGLGTEAVNVAARELVKALRGDDKSRKLALVITFDEAHTLSETKHSNSRGRWSYFSEVRRVLRSLKGERLFALFLSTTGKLAQFVPAREYDSSARVVNGVFTIPVPFTDTGFDQFVVEIEVDGSFTLEQATQVAHMVTYGRPLFATRYFPQDDQVNASPQDNTSTQENESSQETPSSQSSNPSSQSSQRKGKSSSRRKPAVKDLNRVRDDIVRFAMDKLLCRFPGHALEGGANPLGPSETLACLSQRLPIEFMSTTFLQDGEEMKQVESHMRVALKVGEGFRTLSTVTASEPILVEAAIKAMESFSPIKALNFVADGFAVHKGNIGELVGILSSSLLARPGLSP